MNNGKQLLGAVIEKRFKLESVIGRGGLSTVYQGRHEKAGFQVAVKVLHPDYSDTEESRERFKREAAIINNLNHPNIVHMYSYGFLSDLTEGLEAKYSPGKDPLPYLVLEHLAGYGLDTILDERTRLNEKLAYRIIAGVIEGLQFAHDMGIIHRDIKPSNVMIIDELSDSDKSYPGPFSQHVKLLDFGIAKCNKCHDEKPVMQLTQPGFVFGSPLYMSPEQCKGLDVDYRSDIYSLGCMYYEMLCGDPPFKGESAVHTFAMHLYEVPLPLTQTQTDGAVSTELNDIIMKCLAKDPNERWRSVSQLRQALKDLYPRN